MQIPGYIEAIRAERNRRNRAELGVSHTVCGLPVLDITPRSVAILQESGCRYFSDDGDAEDIAVSTVMLLWWQWTKRPRRICPGWYRRRFARMVGKMPSDTLTREIGDWLDWQFADAPPSPDSGGGTKSPPLTSFAVSLADEAMRAGFSRNEALDTPLPILWQHIKLSALRQNPKMPKTNPSDRVRVAWLKERMATNGG
jgi:hypothetical protein